MDALSDPKGYLSAQEKEQAKRAEALAKIGIDETEIDTTNVIQSKGMYIYRSVKFLDGNILILKILLKIDIQ